MSIPTSDTKPDSFYRAPRSNSKQVRKVLEDADPRQVQDFINDLIRRNQLNLKLFWQLLISLALLAVGLIANLPLLVLLAAVTSPVLNPMIGLVLSAIKPSVGYFGKSLFFVLLTAAIYFGAGWLINLVSPSTIDLGQVSGLFALKDGWLEWGVLLVFSVVSVYLFLYRPGGPSVVTSTVLAYLIFIPIAIAGLYFAQGNLDAAIKLLILSSGRFAVSILSLLIAIWVLGFSPKGILGWAFFVIVLAASALLIYDSRFNSPSVSEPILQPAIVEAAVPTEAPTEKKEIVHLPTTVPSQTTQSLKSLQATTPKPSLDLVVSTPPAQFAQVNSESGVVVRESPSTQANIITYINNGLQVTLLGEKVNDQGMDWEKVIAPDGKEGWVAARFLSVINP